MFVTKHESLKGLSQTPYILLIYQWEWRCQTELAGASRSGSHFQIREPTQITKILPGFSVCCLHALKQRTGCSRDEETM